MTGGDATGCGVTDSCGATDGCGVTDSCETARNETARSETGCDVTYWGMTGSS